MAYGEDLPQSFQGALQFAKKILEKNHTLVAENLVQVEAELLVIAAFRKATSQNLSRVEFYSRMQDRYPYEAGQELRLMATGRAMGKPLQHLTGAQVFLEHEYKVSPKVLIPRPETEILVLQAIEHLSKAPPHLGIEIGVGSGAISIELSYSFKNLEMIASEWEDDAIQMAQANSQSILKKTLQIVKPQTSLEVFEPFQRLIEQKKLTSNSVDFIISNPPYLMETDSIAKDVIQYEPHSALFAPKEDSLYFYRKLAQEAHLYLKNNGFVFAEVPHERSEEIKHLFSAHHWNVKLAKDLTQRDRVIVACQ